MNIAFAISVICVGVVCQLFHGSRANAIMASNHYKAPPSLTKSSCYDAWLKEIRIWQKFTDLSNVKQGPAIFLTLEGKAREAVLELEVDDISSQTGVDKIIEKLDTLYQKDKAQTAFESYDNFEKFQRPVDMTISCYINEFERLLAKTKKHGTTMSSDILAYRLLKSANLSQAHEQLARATITGDLSYEAMKKQLKRIFGDNVDGDLAADTHNIKIENVNAASAEDCDTYYGYGRPTGQRRGNFRSNWRGNPSPRRPSRPPMRASRGGRGRNPFDDHGNVNRCAICDSVNHWASTCPDAQYYTESSECNEPLEVNFITLPCSRAVLSLMIT